MSNSVRSKKEHNITVVFKSHLFLRLNQKKKKKKKKTILIIMYSQFLHMPISMIPHKSNDSQIFFAMFRIKKFIFSSFSKIFMTIRAIQNCQNLPYEQNSCAGKWESRGDGCKICINIDMANDNPKNF